LRERGPVSFKSLPDNHLFAMSGNNGAARASQMKDRDSLIGILDALGIKDAYVSALGKLAPPIVGLIDLMMRRAEGIFEAHPKNDAEAAALTTLATELVAIDGTPSPGSRSAGWRSS
jgi:cobalamin biosynthesis protein CbiD